MTVAAVADILAAGNDTAAAALHIAAADSHAGSVVDAGNPVADSVAAGGSEAADSHAAAADSAARYRFAADTTMLYCSD